MKAVYICFTYVIQILMFVDWLKPGGGGGDTWIYFGQGCEAPASKPIPTSKGKFTAWKYYLWTGSIFLQNSVYLDHVTYF